MRPTRLITLLFLMMAGINQAQAGPVIIDGTDANEHGSATGELNQRGWLYMQRALEALARQLPPDVERVLVVMGASPGSIAREAITSAFKKSSLFPTWEIEFQDGAQKISARLSNISTSNAGILYIPTYNELDGDLKPDEMTAINSHGNEIAKFVKKAGIRDGGGALFAMAESGFDSKGVKAFKWIQRLIPGIDVIDLGDPGFDTSISLTDCGLAGLPELPKEELAEAKPWHNYFEGNLGALAVFGTASDEDGIERNVILGGAVADLSISESALPTPVPLGSALTYKIQVTNNGPCPAPLVTVINNLPVSATLLSCSASDGGECNATGNSLKVIFPSLAANTTVTITIMAAVSCPPDGNFNIINPVMVGSDAFDPDPENNLTSLTTTITRASQAKINPQTLEFIPVRPRAKFKKDSTPPVPFTIENTDGCFSLTPRLLSINRDKDDVARGKIGNSDDRALFSVSVANADGSETPVIVGDQPAQVTIAPEQPQIFKVRFHPAIPAFRNLTSGLPSTLVLPCKLKSLLTISEIGTVEIIGRIKPKVILINPDDPKRDAVVTLARSGDAFTVEFTVYDCDPLDLQSVRYEFLDSRTNTLVETLNVTSDELHKAIQGEIDADRLHEGQSFRARKTHHVSKNASKITRVRVTVQGSSTDRATSGDVNSSAGITANSPMFTNNGTVFLPAVNLPPSASKGVSKRSKSERKR